MGKGIFRIFRFLLVVLVFLGNTAATAPSINAQTDNTPEYYFKAAFLANFARLTEWPTSAFQTSEHPLVLCVQDPKPFGQALAEINGKMIKGRKLAVTICRSASELSECHILFINSSDKETRRSAARAVANKPVLLVSEKEGLSEKEEMISFIADKNKIGFEINKTNSEAAGLKISARLLKLSRSVDTENPE